MSRRALTLLLAGALAFALAVTAAVQPVPYVALSPGPAYDTLGSPGGTPVLKITGRPTYPADGTLFLTTVSVRAEVTLLDALSGWLSSSRAVVPREVVFPPDQTDEEVDRQNAEQMAQSQDAATSAALLEEGLPATKTVVVSALQKDAPAAGKLKVGDVLTGIDGHPVTSSEVLRALISHRTPGATVVVDYLRDGKAGRATLTTVASTDTPPRALVGISPVERLRFPVKVAISLKDVGGPSAGLMFALGIIEKLGKDSLTGGHRIAGTGEITAEGKVGPIGGIAQKLIGARNGKATIFLVPVENCAEATSARPDGLTLVKVATLKDALSSLATIRSGGTAPSC